MKVERLEDIYMIDIVALRKKVIDLAIQGKLTQQLLEDGSAENLYAQIQEEKVKLIKEGKIKKEKLLPPISDDEVPYEIPSNWKWVRLGSCIELLSGQDFSPEGYNSDGFGLPYMTGASNIEDGKLIVNRWTEHPKNISCLGDLLLVCKGSGYGKLAINNVGDVHIARQFMAVSAANDLMDLEYVKFYLSGSIMTIKSNGQGLIPGIDRPSVLNMFFPLPPFEEQKRIVEKIEEIFVQIDIIDTLQQKYESDREILKGKIIDAGIRGELTEQLPEDGNAEDLYAKIQKEKTRLIKEGKIKQEKPFPPISEDEIPFEIPVNWKLVRWGDASYRIQYGYNAPAKKVGRIKMLRISDIQNDKVNWDSVPYCDISEEDVSEYLLHENDILFARTGGTVGKSYLVTETPEKSIYAGYLIRTSYSSLICSQYMRLFMDSDFYWKQLREGTIATAQPNCNGKTLAKMIVPLPPLAEQTRIVEIINQVILLMGK